MKSQGTETPLTNQLLFEEHDREPIEMQDIDMC